MSEAPNPQQIQLLLFMQSLSRPQGALHLSLDLSIELSKVARYEPLERTQTVTVGEGKNAREVEQGTGEFDPAIFFDGGDYIVLTEDQNEKFRNIWNVYSRISHEAFQLATQIFAVAAETEGAAA